MRELFIHIGAPKTGTTSIQRFLELNVSGLRNHDVHYPRFFGAARARRLHAFALAEEVATRGLQILNIKEHDVQKFCSEYARDAKAEVEKGGPSGRWLISNELLFSLEKKHIQRVQDLFLPLFDKISVILYIRRQDLRAVSAYVQSIKRDYEFSKPFNYATSSYRKPIENWAHIMGREALTIRLYESTELPDGDVVKDFLLLNDLPLTDDWKSVSRENGPWGPSQIHLARLMNRHFPYLDRSLSRKEQISRRRELLSFIYSLQDRPVMPVRKEEAINFYNLFEEENEWIRSNFFPKKTSLFKESFHMYPNAIPQAAPEVMDQAVLMLWQRHQEQRAALRSKLLRERRKSHALKAESARMPSLKRYLHAVWRRLASTPHSRAKSATVTPGANASSISRSFSSSS